jgi:MoaA/NifB/PqqE/SkfB family radical SAM enzyme
LKFLPPGVGELTSDPFGNEWARRSLIFVGPRCSYRCGFCYYRKRRGRPFLDTVPSQLEFVRKYGILDVEFSGGEPTEDGAFMDHVSEARRLGFRQVCCISNGSALADPSYMRDARDRGMNEVLLSLHGHDRGSHDAVTGVSGSWDRIVSAVENAKSLGVLLRINSTICAPPYDYLPDHARLVREISPTCVNYLPVNYWSDNEDSASLMDYGALAPHLHAALDVLRDGTVPYVNVRYIPFCYMRGYEEHALGHYQHIYDWFDWNLEITSELTSKPYIDRRLLDRRYGEMSYECANRAKRCSHLKPMACVKCSLLYLCDGLEARVADTPVFPYPGEYVRDPMHFRKRYDREMYLGAIG